MKTKFLHLIFLLSLYSALNAANSAAMLTSTEGDPDGFIENCVNVINGDYCEAVTDLIITGPDALFLQRFYNSKNYITGQHSGGWRIFPQCFLVLGNDPSSQSINEDGSVKSFAFVGERSGGILTYTGFRKNGITDAALKIDLKNNRGMVNTYSKEITGQNDHLNNQLYCNGQTCEVILGDGTRRIYEKINAFPSLLLGEEIIPFLADQVNSPEYFRLIQETISSGNHLFFSYNAEGHLASVELKNSVKEKTISWLHFTYELYEHEHLVKITTSDERTLEYHLQSFILANGNFVLALTKIVGSQQIPYSYQYEIKSNLCLLSKKSFFKNRFREINYDDFGRVLSIKDPHPDTGKAIESYSFRYENGYTNVWDIVGLKTCYRFDDNLQLISIEKCDSKNNLYRIDRKFWGIKQNASRLIGKTVSDGNLVIKRYCCYQYDSQGNVVEKQLYGNLTGQHEVSLSFNSNNQLIDAKKIECYKTTFSYSKDGFNLLIAVGDNHLSKTTYSYMPKTNLCIKELCWGQNGVIKKRCFRVYNLDATCTQLIEDDGYSEDAKNVSGVTERHITNICPKTMFPGVGLPEIVEKKVFDFSSKQELLVSKFYNTFDAQGKLLCSQTYDSNDQYAFCEQKSYDPFGYLFSETNFLGQQTFYTYDDYGNRRSILTSHDNKLIHFTYNFRNQLTETVDVVDDLEFTTKSILDLKGRKKEVIDQFGNTTQYSYDDFGRLCNVIFPPVYNENHQVESPSFCYEYDIFGNVVTEIDPCGSITRKFYNLRGDPCKILYPDGSSEFFKYHLRGDLHRTLSRDHIFTYYEYDDQRRISAKNRLAFGKDKPGNYIDSQSYEYTSFQCKEYKNCSLITKYKHDPYGRLISISEFDKNAKDSVSHQTDLEYDNLGRISKKKKWFDNGLNDYSIECFFYDLAGNILKKVVVDSSGKVFLQREFFYDACGRCTEEYGVSEGQKKLLSKTDYNQLGEPILCLDAMGNTTSIHIDYSHYNDLGQKVLRKTIENPFGTKTEIEFDALGRIVHIAKRDAQGQLLSNQQILYDLCGNKSCEIHDQISNGQKSNEQITRWVYGPMGRLDEEFTNYGTSEQIKTTYIYNSLGQLISKTVPGYSTPLKFTYDPAGKVEFICFTDKTLPDTQQIHNQYYYDDQGNIIKAINKLNGCYCQREYDAFNQITKEIIFSDQNKYILNYVHDRKGRVKSITLPDGSSISYTYDAVFGREVNRFSKDGKNLYTHSYNEYDTNGNLLSEILIGKIGKQELKYNLNCKLMQINTPDIKTSIKVNHDELGRITQREIQGLMISSTTNFDYNTLSQLNSEKGPYCNTFEYDSLNNRLKENEVSLTYNSLNQLKFYSNEKFFYNSQGNLSEYIFNDQKTYFETNILSEIVCVKKTDATKVCFQYDPLGRRLVKKHADANGKKIISSEQYLYIGNQEIGTINNDGKIEKLRIPGLSGESLSLKSVIIELDGKTYAPLHGIEGSVTALVDPSSSRIVESYSYSAFGEETIYDSNFTIVKKSILENPWRYAEKRIDHETGLVFFGTRYYNPEIGRWISPDPTGIFDGPNLYAFLHNNPINHFDFFGLSTEDNSGCTYEHYFYGNIEYFNYCVPGKFPGDRYCVGGSRLVNDGGNTLSLPSITYDDDFENRLTNYKSEDDFWNTVDLYDEYRPYYERSKIYDLNLPEIDDLGIGFINGIKNTFKEAHESARHLSRLAGGYNIHGVYNATHGLQNDLYECSLGLNYIATEPVRLLHKMWNNFFDQSSSKAKFLMICHSQGAIHLRNALLDYPEKLRNRIIVLAIAPGAYIYQKSCAQVAHYRVNAFRDPIPRIDQPGGARSQGAVIDLKSHPDASCFDHSLISPTYSDILIDKIQTFIKTQGKNI